MTNPALWGTTTRLTMDVEYGPDPEPGQFLVSAGGSAYLIDSTRRMTRSPRPRRWALSCVRVDPETVPSDAEVIEFRFYGRDRVDSRS